MKKLPIMGQVTFWKVVAAVILCVAAYSTFVRFYYGLGVSTGLTDEFPWGLWIGFDILVGVGLAASGFTIAAVVHIFNAEKYESISRPSLLTAFIGYLLVCAALFFEIGRPLRLWHPIIMWNPHSVMFEVAWCVMMYTTVLLLEFSPLVFEKFKLHLPLAVVRTIYLPVVFVGCVLSTLHQSSLGSYFLIVPDKIHGLWYSPLLPVFFFLSAIGAGLAMTIVQSFLSSRTFGRRLRHDVLDGLARAVAVVLSVYLVFKFRDLSYRHNLGLAFELTPKSVMFWLEVGVGGILPVAIIVTAKGALISEARLFMSSLLAVIGFMLNRLNVSITGMAGSETYVPKWTEVCITLGLVTGGFVAFTYAAHYLPVFPEKNEEDGLERHYSPLPLKGMAGLWAIAIVAVAAYAVAQSRTQPEIIPPVETRKADILAQKLETMPADKVIEGSGDSPGKVTFSHENHIDAQDKGPDCKVCHEKLAFGFHLGDKGKRPTGEGWHAENACGSCHNGTDAFKIKKCSQCHEE